MSEQCLRVGIVCPSPEALAERLLVSRMRVLPPDEAVCQGYIEDEEAIVPTAPRRATIQEARDMLATEDTDIRLQLCRIPRYIGENTLRACQVPDVGRDPEPYSELAPGISGFYRGFRHDGPNQTVVTPIELHNRFTDQLAKIGLHMDHWVDPNRLYLIGNLGAGGRYHCIAPSVMREVTGGYYQEKIVPYIEEQQMTGSPPLLYWLRLEGAIPDDGQNKPTIEACLNSPVARVLHDGSTLGQTQPSTVFYCATAPVADGAYPSVFDK